MMNRSKIDWCDFTWNPVTGCNRGCSYCYARRQATRFSGDTRLNLNSEQIIKNGNGTYILERPFKNEEGTTVPLPTGFAPTLHKYRLNQPSEKKNPAVIFVCSMGDLFAPDIPLEWILSVFDACRKAPQHTYLFLTKYPRRYDELAGMAMLPHKSNFWYGTSVTTPAAELFIDGNFNTFASIEPIKERFPRFKDGIGTRRLIFTDWVIIGAETGHDKNKVTPEREWISDLVDDLRSIGKPVFMKDSKELRSVWGDELIQEFPTGIHLIKDNVPHCKECESCTKTQQGRRGVACYCEREQRPVGGRYARTSPVWCPRRKEEETHND